MRKENERFQDSTLLEGMTSLRGLLQGQKEKINDRKILKIYYDQERLPKIRKEIAFLRHEGERQSFEVIEKSKAEIDSMAIGTSHGGILAECSQRTIPCLSNASLEHVRFAVMLDGIEDPYNFGYAIRSLYASGVDLVVLSERNWMSAAGVVCRSSAGASEQMRMAMTTPEEGAKLFRDHGFSIVYADADAEESVDNASLPFPLFLLVGGEKRGVSSLWKTEADRAVKLVYGRPVNIALSAASAASILAYEIARKNRE